MIHAWFLVACSKRKLSVPFLAQHGFRNAATWGPRTQIQVAMTLRGKAHIRDRRRASHVVNRVEVLVFLLPASPLLDTVGSHECSRSLVEAVSGPPFRFREAAFQRSAWMCFSLSTGEFRPRPGAFQVRSREGCDLRVFGNFTCAPSFCALHRSFTPQPASEAHSLNAGFRSLCRETPWGDAMDLLGLMQSDEKMDLVHLRLMPGGGALNPKLASTLAVRAG